MISREPRRSYVQITELNNEESQRRPLEPALRESVPAVIRRHEEAPHRYNLATQQIRDEEVQQQLEQTQHELHALRIHTAAALNGLKQQQDVDRVAAQLQNSIVRAESMSMYIWLEQQNGLEYLSNILSIAQQGRLPPQLHQQLQQILQPYRQNGQAVQFGKYPVTVQQVTRRGQIYLPRPNDYYTAYAMDNVPSSPPSTFLQEWKLSSTASLPIFPSPPSTSRIHSA